MTVTDIYAGVLMQQPQFNLMEAVRLTRQVVDTFGADYIDPNSENGSGVCRYEVDGKPGCIVGQVLHRAGWTTDALAMLDQGTTFDVFNRLGEAGDFLVTAQAHQDAGKTWGQAVDVALSQSGYPLAA